MSFTHQYRIIKNTEKLPRLVVNTPAIKSRQVAGQNRLPDIRAYVDVRYMGEGDKSPWLDLPSAKIIRNINDKCGCYNNSVLS